MAAIAFLHTSGAHPATFGALVAQLAPGMRDVHVVDEALLADARRLGMSGDVRGRVRDHLRALAREADVIVCTCSTLGDAAEISGAGVAVPVMRLDWPMAQEAMRIGGRVTVVAALEATLEPTLGLLRACAPQPDPDITVALCLDAWPLFEAGDLDGYAALLAAHVRAIAPFSDVVVLAQASMACVEPLVADVGIPVLSSPRRGVIAAARIAAGTS